MSRILIAEDEPRIAAFLEKGLKAKGFITTVVMDGDEAVMMTDSNKFDLLILDLGLPGKDGWMVLEELRGRGEWLPIIILTVTDNVRDKVAGLEGGANDYLTKPFRFEELLARVRVQLRDQHSPKGKEEMVYKADNLTLNLNTHQVWVGDRAVELSVREFILLETFVRHAGKVLSREQLLSKVWGYDYDPSSNIVDVYVGYLRKKLSCDSIETVRGMGYRLRT